MYELDLEIEDVDPKWIKLIKYFHKFWKEKFWEKSHFTYKNRFDNVHVFSKHFWFMEWLLDNNKIDLSDVDQLWYKEREQTIWWIREYCNELPDYENLLALIAINDNPLTFVLSIIK